MSRLPRLGPLAAPRAYGYLLIIVVLAGELGAFKEPAPQPIGMLAVICGILILTICKAHDSIIAELRGDA